MKFTTILFSLAVVATNGMSDDMDNTTDTTAAAASSDEGGGSFIDKMKEGWGQLMAGGGCLVEALKIYDDNPDLEAAKVAWEASAVKTNVKSEGENSWTFAYDMELCKKFMEACNNVDGMTFTPMPEATLECTYYGFGNGNETATVATSGNGVCIPDTEKCQAIDGGPTAIGNSEMYSDLENNAGLVCKTLVSDSSGGVVPSTNFLGSVVVATAVLAFTVLN